MDYSFSQAQESCFNRKTSKIKLRLSPSQLPHLEVYLRGGSRNSSPGPQAYMVTISFFSGLKGFLHEYKHTVTHLVLGGDFQGRRLHPSLLCGALVVLIIRAAVLFKGTSEDMGMPQSTALSGSKPPDSGTDESTLYCSPTVLSGSPLLGSRTGLQYVPVKVGSMREQREMLDLLELELADEALCTPHPSFPHEDDEDDEDDDDDDEDDDDDDDDDDDECYVWFE
ncbi:Armadillo-like helical containing protein [Cricetulus griseus]|nr:Armadillo-like helical containing protein [Cricetulus griseus]